MEETVLLIDDHASVREGLAWILRTVWGRTTPQNQEQMVPTRTVVAVASCEEALEILEGGVSPQAIVLDYFLGGTMASAEVIQRLQSLTSAPIVVLSSGLTRSIAEEVRLAGASCATSKSVSPQILRSIVNLAIVGGTYLPDTFDEAWPLSGAGGPAPALPAAARSAKLTAKQHAVLACLAQGKSNREIATFLNSSESTIRAHVAAVLRVLGAENRTAAVALAFEQGLVESGPSGAS